MVRADHAASHAPDARPTGRRGGSLAGWLLLAALLLPACACPPLDVDYSSPEATLATFQAQLCRADRRGEFRCLSAGLQDAMGGWTTYLAVRRQLVEENELLVWMLGRADLTAAIDREASHVGEQLARLVLTHGERSWTVRCVLESAVIVELDDGRELFGLPRDAEGAPLLLQEALGQSGPQQWLRLPTPFLTEDELAAARRLRFEHRWKIDDLQGLLLAPET